MCTGERQPNYSWSPGVRLQPLLQQAVQAGSSLGSPGKRIARHVPCKSRGSSRHGLRFNLGLIKHPQAAGEQPVPLLSP